MKKTRISIGVFGIIAMLVYLPFGYSASSPVTHSVTVTVNSILSLTADTGAFTLTFSDFISGTNSDTKLVIYTVKANSMQPLTGAVKGKLDTLYTGMDFKGDVGSYTSTGGNSTLTESTAGFITIATTDTNLANSSTVSGNGKILRGTLPVTYRATATTDLEAGSQIKTLTITLIDA